MAKVAVIAILQCRHLKMGGNLRNLCVPPVVRSFGIGWLPCDLSWQGLFPPGWVAVAPGRRNSAEMHQTSPPMGGGNTGDPGLHSGPSVCACTPTRLLFLPPTRLLFSQVGCVLGNLRGCPHFLGRAFFCASPGSGTEPGALSPVGNVRLNEGAACCSSRLGDILTSCNGAHYLDSGSSNRL